MKPWSSLSLIPLLFSLMANGQDINPQSVKEIDTRFYIGLGVGPSLVFSSTNYYSDPEVGLNLNLLNTGVTIVKNFGVTINWMGGAHVNDVTNSFGLGTPIPGEEVISYGTLMIGPMYTVSLSQNTALDLKARLGRFYSSHEVTAKDPAGTSGAHFLSEVWSLGYSIATTYRYSLSPHFCLIVSGDYYFKKYNQFSHFRALTFHGGIGFQL